MYDVAVILAQDVLQFVMGAGHLVLRRLVFKSFQHQVISAPNHLVSGTFRHLLILYLNIFINKIFNSQTINVRQRQIRESRACVQACRSEAGGHYWKEHKNTKKTRLGKTHEDNTGKGQY